VNACVITMVENANGTWLLIVRTGRLVDHKNVFAIKFPAGIKIQWNNAKRWKMLLNAADDCLLQRSRETPCLAFQMTLSIRINGDTANVLTVFAFGITGMKEEH